ncbi:MAG: hypothetical protein AB7S26_03850 [Sandaracinaceae bacterium]
MKDATSTRDRNAPPTRALAMGGVAVAIVALVASHAEATVLVDVSLEDMARDADVIVVGRVIRSEAQLVLDPVRGADPHTLTTVQVSEWIVGPGGATVVVDELGGEVAGQGLAIAGTARYEPGQEVVLFLERAGTRLRTYGMALGRFEIRRGVGGAPDSAFRDLHGVAFATWQGGRMELEERAEPAVSLDTFLAYVRSIANGYRPLPNVRGGLSR